jgi:hypothetical protein
MYSTIDVIEYNLNDNYRRYGIQSSDGAVGVGNTGGDTNANSINATLITTGEIDSTLGIITSIQTDSLTAGIITTNQMGGFQLTGPIQFSNQPTTDLVVTNLTASGGSITNMSNVESECITLKRTSGSVILKANVSTLSHTLTFPPSNQVGILMNNGFGNLRWDEDPIINSVGIGSNIFIPEAKLHIKGDENTGGGLIVESNVVGTALNGSNRLSIFPDTSGGSGIQKLSGLQPLTFYNTVGGKEFELKGDGDSVFYNDLSVQGSVSGGGKLTLRVRTTTSGTDLEDDYILNVNNTGTANIDLPSISNPLYTGVQYIVIPQTSSTVRIRADGSDTIFTGGSSINQIVLSGTPGDLRHLVNNGFQWFTLPS